MSFSWITGILLTVVTMLLFCSVLWIGKQWIFYQ